MPNEISRLEKLLNSLNYLLKQNKIDTQKEPQQLELLNKPGDKKVLVVCSSNKKINSDYNTQQEQIFKYLKNKYLNANFNNIKFINYDDILPDNTRKSFPEDVDGLYHVILKIIN